MKPYRDALALVFNDDGKVLSVKRSALKDSFPNFWSLPSTWIKEGEHPSHAAYRLARNKLGLDSLEIARNPLGNSEEDRGIFILRMFDYEVVSSQGRFNLNPTEYTEMRWVTPEELKDLFDKEHNGIMGECCRAFLKSKGLI